MFCLHLWCCFKELCQLSDVCTDCSIWGIQALMETCGMHRQEQLLRMLSRAYL